MWHAMWNLNSNRLSYEEYWDLRHRGASHPEIIKHAKSLKKQCNSNLCTLYKKTQFSGGQIRFNGYSITADNLSSIPINRVYIPYFREQLGLPPRRHTVGNCAYLLTDVQRQVIIGSLLGDGYIPKKQSSLHICHGHKQLLYMQHKKQLLGRLVKSRIKYHHYTNRGKEATNIYLSTTPHQFIKEQKTEFYPGGIKCIPENSVKMLQPLGLAIWYCDDGAVMRNKARLCTNCFTKTEIQNTVHSL